MTVILSCSTQFAFAVVKIVWLCPGVTEPVVPAAAVSAMTGDCAEAISCLISLPFVLGVWVAGGWCFGFFWSNTFYVSVAVVFPVLAVNGEVVH